MISLISMRTHNSQAQMNINIVFCFMFIASLVWNESRALSGFEQKSVSTEDVELHFITRLRQKRSMNQNQFHILKVHRTSSNDSFQLHLAKSNRILSEQLKPVIRRGNYEKTAAQSNLFGMDCVYHGVASGSIAGEASLSACGNTRGFSGVIVTNTGLYSLEPKSSIRRVDNEHNSISHTLTSMDDLDSDDNGLACAGAIAESPKATINAAVHNEKPRTPEIFRQHTTNKVKSEKLIYKPPGARLSTLVTRQTTTSSPFMSFIANYSPIQQNMPPQASKRTIELAIFVDESLISYLFSKLNTTRLKEVQAYIHVLANVMAIGFRHPSLEQHVNFQIVHEEFWQKNPEGFDHKNGSLSLFLESFCQYVNKQNEDTYGYGWDHAMLLTAMTLTRSNMTYGGVAYLDGSCSQKYSCSIVKSTTFYAASSMIHEIGHSLGINHDGEDQNTKCPSTGYFMSGISGAGRVSWSSCSNANMRDFLKFLDSKTNENGFRHAGKYNKDCLQSVRSRKENSILYSTVRLPGEDFPPAFQCAFADKTFAYVYEKDAKNFCKKLFCTNANKSLVWNVHAPLEGSECGVGKWCRHGECVQKPSATPNKV